MSENIKKKEFAELLAKKMMTDQKTAEMWIDAFSALCMNVLNRGAAL